MTASLGSTNKKRKKQGRHICIPEITLLFPAFMITSSSVPIYCGLLAILSLEGKINFRYNNFLMHSNFILSFLSYMVRIFNLLRYCYCYFHYRELDDLFHSTSFRLQSLAFQFLRRTEYHCALNLFFSIQDHRL